MGPRALAAGVLLLALAAAGGAAAGAGAGAGARRGLAGRGRKGRKHHFEKGDVVPLFVNKAGPFNNPSETYQFYDLPFCRPEKMKNKLETLGEVRAWTGGRCPAPSRHLSTPPYPLRAA